jgi:hypothetical protein
MKQTTSVSEVLPVRPIRVGFTCWRWETQRPKAILRLAQRLGVNVTVTVKNRWLQRDVEAQVSGRNVDHFIGEFAKRC